LGGGGGGSYIIELPAWAHVVVGWGSIRQHFALGSCAVLLLLCMYTPCSLFAQGFFN